MGGSRAAVTAATDPRNQRKEDDMAQLSLATCQFEIRTQVAKNLQAITRQMKQAKSKGAHLVHFPRPV